MRQFINSDPSPNRSSFPASVFVVLFTINVTAKYMLLLFLMTSRAVSSDSNKLDMIIQPCEPTVMRPHQLRLDEKQALTVEAVCEELHWSWTPPRRLTRILNRDIWLSAGAVKEKQYHVQARNQRISFDLAFVSIARPAQGQARNQRISCDLAFVSSARPAQCQEELELCVGRKWSICGLGVPISVDVKHHGGS